MKKFLIIPIFFAAFLMTASIPVFAQNVNTGGTNAQLLQIQAQIQQLQAQINDLLRQIQALSGSKTTETSTPATGLNVFNMSLQSGSRGEPVSNLQNALRSDPSIYPEGLVTGYFGPFTKNAVKRFQAKYNIVSGGDANATGSGIVGPQTNAMLNTVFGGASGGTQQSTGNNIPAIFVFSPNGGEKWPKGSDQTIVWSAPSSVSMVNIELLDWQTPCDIKTQLCPAMPSILYSIAKKASYSGLLVWNAGKDVNGSDIPVGQYIIRVSDAVTGIYDQSDAPFSISDSASSTSGGSNNY